MGVKGWTKFLAESGWLPSNNSTKQEGGQQQECRCCSGRTSPWRDAVHSADPFSSGGSILGLGTHDGNTGDGDFASRIVGIPPGSTFLVDGHGLAFHLLSVSYARNVARILARNENSNSKRRPILKNLTPYEVQQLLPNWMPLSVLEDVTQEYITTLVEHGIRPVVYWDGPARRRVKQATGAKRRSRIDDEWAALRAYCLYGIVPDCGKKGKASSCCVCCEWERQFPLPRMFKSQIMHTLRRLAVAMKNCREECDHVIARDATRNPHCYVLGSDSDFCFFPEIQYIPLNTLSPSPPSSMHRQLTACIIRRNELADWLGLPNERLIIELALLCGNDYLVNPREAKLSYCSGGGIEDACQHLEDQDADYELTSHSAETSFILDFVRTLYSLGDIDRFPLDDEVGEEAERGDGGGAYAGQDEGDNVEAIERPDVPKGVDFSSVRVDPTSDRSVKDAVLRFLQQYLHLSVANSSTNRRVVLSPLHVAVFRSMDCVEIDDGARRAEREAGEILAKDPTWRPRWDDEIAVHFIARAISACLDNSSGSPLARLASPALIFNPYRYHVLLRRARVKVDNDAGASHPPPNVGNASHLFHSPAPVYGQLETETNQPLPQEERPDLPVDHHEETILRAIEKNRITIIQGETGCGKSSRIPVMILKAPPPDESLKEVKLYVSQPRRIAAKALVERLRAVEPDLKDCFALRMGHGVREYEKPNTRAWFVTAGYLVRRLAGQPHLFDKVSHLIVDEVHERSVETDLLCLLCRRLLKRNKHIRLVLMSATLAAKLYQDYFGVPEPPIKVGARRFPVEEVYLEELESRFALNSKMKSSLDYIKNQCQQLRCKGPPSVFYMEKLYPIVAQLALIVGKPGSSVLIFVPGMVDIVAITEAIELLHVSGIHFNCFPIHSDIPFEDQMDVFAKPEAEEVRVIIATNAAESSLTLPDVDHVICLGLCKQIVYNELSHRQMLVPVWVSRASATQRAGRTGRLRHGTVYRLYTRHNYEKDMNEFEPGEISRIPLDNIILLLKGMLAEEGVTEVLLNTLEPPNTSTIDRSFQSLFRSHFISAPEDDCEITTLGHFVSSLGIDLALGSVIGLGIQFGVGPEAIELAGVLSFPKTPWIMTSPLIHEPKEYNEMTKKSYLSKCHFDANLYSEPLATMNMLYEFEHQHERKQAHWCWKNALAYTRVRRLAAVCKNLKARVAEFFQLDNTLLDLKEPPSQFPHSKVTTLRVIQAWVFYDTVIECRPENNKMVHVDGGVGLHVQPRSDNISMCHLQQVLCSERHSFTLTGIVKIQQKGNISLDSEASFSVEERKAAMGERFVSYSIEEECLASWFWDHECLVIYIDEALLPGKEEVLHDISKEMEVLKVVLMPNQSRRGIGERQCGKWKVDPAGLEQGQQSGQKVFSCFSRVACSKKQKKSLKEVILRLEKRMQSDHTLKSIACNFMKQQSREKKPFTITSYGFTSGISSAVLRDLFAAGNVTVDDTQISTGKQMVVFSKDNDKGKSLQERASSWERPPVECIPEGARLLSVLASGRRREHLVRLDSLDDSDEEVQLDVDLYLDPSQTKLSQRWNRFATDRAVYVNENCVPATALPVDGTEILYCVVANTLEVRGGGIKVEGLTLLPKGALFLLLTRISFGLLAEEGQEDDCMLEEDCVRLLRMLTRKQSESLSDKKKEDLESEWKRRINMAMDFHAASRALGEQLVCFPDMSNLLKVLFDGVDGYDIDHFWDIQSNIFTEKNLRNNRRASSFRSSLPATKPKRSGPTAENDDDPSSREKPLPMNKVASSCPNGCSSSAYSEEERLAGLQERNCTLVVTQQPESTPLATTKSRTTPVITSLKKLDGSWFDTMRHLFATDGQPVTEYELPSTNLLALIVEHVYVLLGDKFSSMSSNYYVHWSLYTGAVDDNSRLYQARFTNCNLCFTEPHHSTANLPNWYHGSVRPNTVQDALDCAPPMFRDTVLRSTLEVRRGPSSSNTELVFTSIEMALRMEAAFWLERQFHHGTYHWYEQGDVSEMIRRLVETCKAQGQFDDAA